MYQKAQYKSFNFFREKWDDMAVNMDDACFFSIDILQFLLLTTGDYNHMLLPEFVLFEYLLYSQGIQKMSWTTLQPSSLDSC